MENQEKIVEKINIEMYQEKVGNIVAAVKKRYIAEEMKRICGVNEMIEEKINDAAIDMANAIDDFDNFAKTNNLNVSAYDVVEKTMEELLFRTCSCCDND